MPIYSYRCPKCNRYIDRNIKMSERNNQYCDICKTKLERVVKPIATKFKGSGWTTRTFDYVDKIKEKAYKKDKKEDKYKFNGYL